MFRRLRNFFGWYTKADRLFYREERIKIDREHLKELEAEMDQARRQLHELRCADFEVFRHKRMMMDYYRKRQSDIDRFRRAIEDAEARLDHDRIYGVPEPEMRVIMNQRK